MHLRVSLLPVIAALAACLPSPARAVPLRSFELTIAHVADSHLRSGRSLRVPVRPQGRRVVASVHAGGPEVLDEAVRVLRLRERNLLLLHGGDFLPSKGRPYDRERQQADTRFWNRLGLDAAVIGNHEYDYGPRELRLAIVDQARFPLLSANTDLSREPWLQDVGIEPYVIRRVGGERVGIIGLTLATTPRISLPGPHIVFRRGLADAQKASDDLRRQGVNKIVLLSHMGIRWDLSAARELSGVDVIVGGHTHLRLGRFRPLPWLALGPYPIVQRSRAGDPVLVVHASRGLEVLGCLRVRFNEAGRIDKWQGEPLALLAPASEYSVAEHSLPALRYLARVPRLFVSGFTTEDELLLAEVPASLDDRASAAELAF